MRSRTGLIVSVIVVAVLAVVLVVIYWLPSPPKISFAPYGEPYEEKPNFALVEQQFPLKRGDLKNITLKELKAYNQEQLDQLYARLHAGPIPDGPFDGEVLRPEDAPMDRIAEAVGGLKGLALKFKRQKLGIIMNTLWKGKVFYRDQRVLRNRIEDMAILKPLIGGDIPKISVDGKDAWLLFPAKLHCGQSLLDGRRESIIIDYAFTDEIDGYREIPDFLAGRNGFKVRDEIRMIRPGFYLGRAYMSRIFVLNFTLYNDEIAKRDTGAFLKTDKINEDCWVGTQQVASLSK